MAKKSGFKKALITVYSTLGVLVLLGAGGVYAYKTGMFKPHPNAKPSVSQLKSWQLTLPKMTTNTGGGNLVQLTVVVQCGSKKSLSDVTNAQNQIQDSITSTLLATNGLALKTPNGEAKFKAAVLAKVKKIVPGDPVLSIIIPQIIVQ